VQLVAKTFTGRTAIIDGEVVAHFQGGSKDIQRAGIVMPLLAMQALYETDTVTIWSVWLKDATNLHAVQRQLAKSLEDEGLTVDILPWTDGRVNPLYTGTINFFTAILVFLTLVLIGIVVLSIFNAASMTVIERAPEIGMMRSLGFTRGAISKIFAAESLILSVIAMLIGSTLALAGIATVNHANIHLTPPGIAGGTFLKVEPGWSVVLGVVALITATTLSTALVAVKSVVRARIPSLLDGSRR
jgi:putative ABC transport system permease protein